MNVFTLSQLQLMAETVQGLLNSPDGQIFIKFAFVPKGKEKYILSLAVHYDPNDQDIENYHIQYHDYKLEELEDLTLKDLHEKFLDMAEKIFYNLNNKRPHLTVVK